MYKRQTTFNLETTTLIQVDIDDREISKNYTPDVAVVGDAKQVLASLSGQIEDTSGDLSKSEYLARIQELREIWLDEIAPLRDSDAVPSTVPRFYRELREVLNRDAIVVTSSGHAQACVLEFPFYEPKTNLTSGGFSTMGWACLLYTSPSPRDQRGSRMPSSA